MGTTNEQQLYNSAKAYYHGAEILMNKISPESPTAYLLIQPAVTCASLSLKLYLKCLLAIEDKDREDSIYKIADLYRNLKEETRKTILGKFDEFSNTSLSNDDLIKHLEGLDNAFVRWRYLHEEDAKCVNLDDLDQMILASKATISAARPGWE